MLHLCNKRIHPPIFGVRVLYPNNSFPLAIVHFHVEISSLYLWVHAFKTMSSSLWCSWLSSYVCLSKWCYWNCTANKVITGVNNPVECLLTRVLWGRGFTWDQTEWHHAPCRVVYWFTSSEWRASCRGRNSPFNSKEHKITLNTITKNAWPYWIFQNKQLCKNVLLNSFHLNQCSKLGKNPDCPYGKCGTISGNWPFIFL